MPSQGPKFASGLLADASHARTIDFSPLPSHFAITHITPSHTPAMTDRLSVDPPWRRLRLRVPREDGAVFAFPSLEDAIERIAENRLLLADMDATIQGKSFHDLRGWARNEIVQTAVEYTSEICGQPVAAPDEFASLVVGGHQPSLFHSGVWAKNFAIHHLARQTEGLSLNLVVDNDTLGSTSIRVPAGDVSAPSIASVAFDTEHHAEPWEQATIRDRSAFESFGQRIAEAMAAFDIDPLIRTMWPDAVEVAKRTDSLRDCLTAARHRTERAWGVSNLELPISRMCGLDSFLWFASHLFAFLPRFREIHNEVLAEYRRINRIRSRTHPVPELGERDGWIEAPFWVFRGNNPTRHRVFARQQDQTVLLADENEQFAVLPLSPDMDACCAVEVLRDLSNQGIGLRTRALTTTLFSRICFGDLFVHGIGGAKYDEMTDRILARFFGITPPAFQTVSATLHLPLGPVPDVTSEDDRRVMCQLRDLTYNPDRYLGPNAPATAHRLGEEKSALTKEERSKADRGRSAAERRNNYSRYRRLLEINRDLQPFIRDERARLEAESGEIQRLLSVKSVLTDREFSIGLFPEMRIRQFMMAIR